MKKLIFILLVIIASCEIQKDEKQFDIVVGVENWSSYEIEFPEMPKTDTNPLHIIRTYPDWEFSKTITITCESPLVIRARHSAPMDWIKVKVYENGKLLAADSLEAKVAEIWLTYEW